VISGLLRTAAGTIDLTAVAAAANKYLRSTTDTHEQPRRSRHRRRLAHAWTTIAMLGIMPRHACSARCGARRRFGTWRFRSAPCLPIWQVVNAQLCARSTSSHLRRTPTCGYVDNASALPTDPQDQKTTKVSVNLIALKAQHSDPVHHHPDRQAGQPRHPSPHSVSILAAIHSIRAEYGTWRALGASEGSGSASASSREASVKHFTHAMKSLVIASRDRCSACWVR
jgi:hypothetical protein